MELRRKIVHIATVLLALLLVYLPAEWAALLVFVTLVFNFFFIPRLLRGVQRPGRSGLDAGIALFPVSLLLLVVLFGGRLEVVAGAWALMAVGDGFATLAGQYLKGPRLPWNPQKSFCGLLAFIIAGLPACFFLMQWTGSTAPVPVMLTVAAVATCLCALIESLPLPVNDNLTVPLIGGALLYTGLTTAEFVPLFISEHLTVYLFWASLCLNLGGALLGLFFRALNVSGVVAAVLVGFFLFLLNFWGWVLVIVFFLVGTLVTMFSHSRRKEKTFSLSAEMPSRNAWQVLAKSFPAAFFAFLAACSNHSEMFQIAMVASIATALSDTVESELGRLFGKKPFLPSTFARTVPGTTGAVSLEGTLLGLTASLGMILLAKVLYLIEWQHLPVILIASFAACYLESWLGSSPSWQTRFGSAGRNFVATLAGGLTAVVLFMML
jgi:uncharacterized protein (TIGR00297 family)